MRIAIWAGNYGYWKSVRPSNLWDVNANQMGGSEAAALSIALALANAGHHVLFGSKVEYPETLRTAAEGTLRTCPVDLFPNVIFVEEYDVLVAWDDAYLFRFAYPHIPVKVLCYQLNDTVGGLLFHTVDRFFHPSQWHANRFAEIYNVPKSKQRIGLTNGISLKRFENVPIPTRANHVVWASSPDRGLHHLLRMWPVIKEQVPDAELHIYYDMDKWLSIVTGALQQGQTLITTDRALEVKELLVPLSGDPSMGVTYHGGVSRAELGAAMLRAKVMAYPCDPVAPTEGFSMTTLEAWAAGCRVVVSDADALQELWGGQDGIACLPLPVSSDIWIDQIVRALQADVPAGPREVPDWFDWSSIARKWENEFKAITA